MNQGRVSPVQVATLSPVRFQYMYWTGVPVAATDIQRGGACQTKSPYPPGSFLGCLRSRSTSRRWPGLAQQWRSGWRTSNSVLPSLVGIRRRALASPAELIGGVLSRAGLDRRALHPKRGTGSGGTPDSSPGSERLPAWRGRPVTWFLSARRWGGYHRVYEGDTG
jgi:hypothetical protein